MTDTVSPRIAELRLHEEELVFATCMTHTIRKATADDAGRLAELAAVTFPLACPPGSSPEDIAAHLANTLSERHFRAYLADPDVTVLVIDADGEPPRLQPAGGPPRLRTRTWPPR